MTPDSTNPYVPPGVVESSDEAAPFKASYPEAGKGTRFANLLLDYVGCILLTGVVMAPIEVISPGYLEAQLNPVVEQFFSWIVMLVYYIGFEATLGRTLGKFLTGTAVLTVQGTKPSFGQIVGRTFSRFVPFEPFSFLGSGDGWHDKWSGTRVVKTRGQG